MLPGTPYVRRKGYVRIHTFIRMLQVNLVPLHTIYSRTYIVRGTSWYQPVIPVPAGTSPWQLENISPPSSTNTGTPYVRRKGYVRIHTFISMLQVNLVPLHTIYSRTYI